METFNLLKHWISSGAANLRTSTTNLASSNARTTTTSNMTIASSVFRPSTESDDDEDSFFDLEFAVENSVINDDDSTSESGDEVEHKGKVNFAVSSSPSSSSSSEPSISLSPSDELFFKGQLIPLEPSSIVITNPSDSDSDSKSSQFPISLLKSATKFRVFMLGLRKPKSPHSDTNAPSSPKQNQNQNKFFIKFKVQEVPVVSLFTRKKLKSPRSGEEPVTEAEEKKFPKETVQKYINKFKPLYVRVSRRYGEKLRFSGHFTAEGAAADVSGRDEAEGEAAVPSEAPAKLKLPERLRIGRKRLGKSKSASLVVVGAVASPRAVQQEDGIESAIAHCKRSLNADNIGSGSSAQWPLVRSKSDPTDKGNRDRCA